MPVRISHCNFAANAKNEYKSEYFKGYFQLFAQKSLTNAQFGANVEEYLAWNLIFIKPMLTQNTASGGSTMPNKNKKERLVTLYETLSSMQTPQEVKRLLEDLCTENELHVMAQRLLAAKMLMDGKTYVQIIEETGLSSATLSRISKCVHFGKGYSRLKQ